MDPFGLHDEETSLKWSRIKLSTLASMGPTRIRAWAHETRKMLLLTYLLGTLSLRMEVYLAEQLFWDL
jgi:hypothetical protein